MAVNGERSEISERLSRDWTIDLSAFDHAKKMEICKELKKLFKEYEFKYEIGPQLKKELSKDRPDLLAFLPE
jgi:hypothetical protein